MAPGAARSSRTSSQCISTHECQSKLPKKIGCRSLGRCGKSPGSSIVHQMSLGNSRSMLVMATRAYAAAFCSSRDCHSVTVVMVPQATKPACSGCRPGYAEKAAGRLAAGGYSEDR